MVHSKRRIGWAIKFLMAIILVVSKPSYALDLSIVGAGTESRPVTNNVANGFGQQLGLGGGLLLDQELNNYFSLQLGGILVSRSFSNQLGGSSTIDQLQYIQVPLELKLWAARWLSLNAGAYYAFGVGNVSMTSGSNTTTTSFANYGLKSQDYGWLAGLSLSIPFSSRVTFYVEPQYVSSLDNALASPATNASNFMFRDVQLLLGLRFKGIGDPRPEYYQDYESYSRRYW